MFQQSSVKSYNQFQRRALQITLITTHLIHPLYTLTTNDLRWTQRMHTEDEWVKMHSELLTNGVKHTHSVDTHLRCKVKMNDMVKMLPELDCRWQMNCCLSGCTDPLLWLSKGELFCNFTNVKKPALHLLFSYFIDPQINY